MAAETAAGPLFRGAPNRLPAEPLFSEGHRRDLPRADGGSANPQNSSLHDMQLHEDL